MLLKDFREALLDRLLMFLWRQWSALGVLGASTTEEEWIIDPEPLLIFSLELARYEPRLFDEILAWLVVNGELLDTARLRRILLKQDVRVVRVIGGALQWTADRKLIYERKWRKILDRCQAICEENPSDDVAEVLFKDKSGKSHPSVHGDSCDPSFALFHMNRPKINVQKEAKEVPINARANLRFPVRALFGAGAKAEAILYLLTHEGGRPREIADSVGLFWLSVQQALFDLSRSGLVLTRTKGKKVEYWLSQKKWWEFLASMSPEDRALPKFLDWIAIFTAFSSLWNTAEEIAAGTESDYMKNSKLQDSMEVVAREFARSGYDPAYAPPSGLPPEMQRKMTLRYFDIIFDLRPELASFANH